jgi:hypothetical protein
MTSKDYEIAEIDRQIARLQHKRFQLTGAFNPDTMNLPPQIHSQILRRAVTWSANRDKDEWIVHGRYTSEDGKTLTHTYYVHEAIVLSAYDVAALMASLHEKVQNQVLASIEWRNALEEGDDQ